MDSIDLNKQGNEQLVEKTRIKSFETITRWESSDFKSLFKIKKKRDQAV